MKRGKKIDWEGRLEDCKVAWEREEVLKEWIDNWSLRSADTKKMSSDQFSAFQIEGKILITYILKAEGSKSEWLSYVRQNTDQFTDYIQFLKENKLKEELELILGDAKS